MGIFQVASIFELNFVIGQVNRNNLDEQASGPSLCRIIVTYLIAFVLSSLCIVVMLYWVQNLDFSNERYVEL